MNEPLEPDRPSRIVLREHGGPPPGYCWTVDLMGPASADARKVLTTDQYNQIASQFTLLAANDEATRHELLDIRPIENYHELRDKGGIFGRTNVRVFYFAIKDPRIIVILGVVKKENDGPTQMHTKFTMRKRRRDYLKAIGLECD